METPITKVLFGTSNDNLMTWFIPSEFAAMSTTYGVHTMFAKQAFTRQQFWRGTRSGADGHGGHGRGAFWRSA